MWKFGSPRRGLRQCGRRFEARVGHYRRALLLPCVRSDHDADTPGDRPHATSPSELRKVRPCLDPIFKSLGRQRRTLARVPWCILLDRGYTPGPEAKLTSESL